MSETTTTHPADSDHFDNLRKELERLQRRNVFPYLPSFAGAIGVGVCFGALAYMCSSNSASAFLIGLAVSLASIALNEARRLRQQNEDILDFLDKRIAAFRPE